MSFEQAAPRFPSGWQPIEPVNEGGPVNEHPPRDSWNMASTSVTDIQDHMTVLRAASILGVPVSELTKLTKPKLSTMARPNTLGLQVEWSRNDNHLANSPLWLTGYPMFRKSDNQFPVPDLDPFCGDTNSGMNVQAQEYQYSPGSEIMSSIFDEAFRGISPRNPVNTLSGNYYVIRGQSTPTCQRWGEQGQIASQSIGSLRASSLQSPPTSCAPGPWNTIFGKNQFPQLSPEMPLPNCGMSDWRIGNYNHETAFDLPQQNHYSSQTLRKDMATFSGSTQSMTVIPNEHELIFHTTTSQLDEPEALEDVESSPDPILSPPAARHSHDPTVPGQELPVGHPSRGTPPKSWARKARSSENDPNPRKQRRRGPFSDLQARAETARTRKLKACIPCKFNKVRCKANADDPTGICRTCGPSHLHNLSRQPCFRYNVTDASLYRDQELPSYFAFTRRWGSMKMANITEWASPETKLIKVTQDFGKASYELKVKEFIPMPGECLEEAWADGNVMKSRELPPWAIASMEEAADELWRYVDDNIGTYVWACVGNSDSLIRSTFEMVIRYSEEAPRQEEKTLLQNILRIWVTARMASNIERICGEETLGMSNIDDPSCPWHARIPIPPAMCVQLEIILYCKFLAPLKKAILGQLQKFIFVNKKENWDYEFGKRLLKNHHFANPEIIRGLHMGATMMLAHFHHCSKGYRPFTENWDSAEAAVRAAGLSAEQVQFINCTARQIQAKKSDMKRIKEERNFLDDNFFTSQLFDEEWRPIDTL
ncbi:uncharacterized protein PAC_05673 [Phialocephala subalpina]|uniref:Zn(2)-C6 fungal-type domain-containing protein n=1 Tax=Phialocephala subalpina TaxID=576137 RepID=A0A1L7WSN8_9HELO|nr:uncharacterized protein PAC_05673 [Phialocephala subalpina]